VTGAGSWRLGDRTVHRLGYGAMRITGSGPFDLGTPSDRGDAIRILRRAVDLGVDHIDTAAFYFSRLRSANELIGTALQPYPDGLVIATKVGPSRDAGGGWRDFATPAELRGQVEENLRQLGRDDLDLVYLRVPGSQPLGDHFAALAEMVAAGLVRHLGVSAVTAAQLEEARQIAPVVAVQNRYGVGMQRDDEVLRQCGTQGIAFVPFFALAGEGRHKGPPADAAEVVTIAERHGATPAQVKLAWTLHQGPHVLAIPGTGNLAHLEENVAAGDLRLTPAELDVLAGVTSVA
jgi:pyridoxine 4-dehydrogenase